MDKIKPRIGRQVKHFEMLDLESIKAKFSRCNSYRYLLKFNYQTQAQNLFDENSLVRDKVLTIILKNPSSANAKAADNTIQRVEKYVYEHFKDVLSVNVLNIFAIRATDAIEVNHMYKQEGDDYINGPQNNKNISSAIREADYIITAWGGRSGINKKVYDARIEEVVKLIKKKKSTETNVYRVHTEKGSEIYPFHACFWSMKYEKILLNY